MNMFPTFYFKDNPELQHAYQFTSSQPPYETYIMYFLKKHDDDATIYDVLVWGGEDNFLYESVEVLDNEYSSWKIIF